MKKIFFGKGGENHDFIPIWSPQTLWGFIWRTLVFLLIIFTIFTLISMLQRCDSTPQKPQPEPSPIPDTTQILPPDPQPPLIDSTQIEIDPQDSITQIIGNQLLVLFDGDADLATFEHFAKQFKQIYKSKEYYVAYYRVFTQTMILIVPPAERINVARQLPKQITDIKFYVADVELIDMSYVPNDRVFSEETLCWWYEPIQAYGAWDITKGNKDIIIGVIDSYFDLKHDELKSDRVYEPFNIVTNTSNIAPPKKANETARGHGSLVASIAAGNMDNKKGIAGIAPQCRLMPVSLGGQLTSVSQLEAMMYCIKKGANVINASFGASFAPWVQYIAVEDQIEIAKQTKHYGQAVWNYVFNLANKRNVTIVWAAGNENVFTALDKSKRNQTTIKVSAVDRNLRKANFSNYGNFVEYNQYQSTISAPGETICGAIPNNEYAAWDGTSFAAPIVTGTVALMKSIDPTLTNSEIIDILIKTGKPVADAPEIGKLIQIKDALEAVQNRFANFCDIQKQPELLLGWWKTTKQLTVIDSDDKETGEKVYIYYRFDKNGTGKALYKETTGHDYESQLTWSINQDQLHISVPQLNSTTTNQTFIPSEVNGAADEECLLSCTEEGRGTKYKLIKLEEQP